MIRSSVSMLGDLSDSRCPVDAMRLNLSLSLIACPTCRSEIRIRELKLREQLAWQPMIHYQCRRHDAFSLAVLAQGAGLYLALAQASPSRAVIEGIMDLLIPDSIPRPAYFINARQRSDRFIVRNIVQ
jgi:hypothetical protein